jgi:hypothetical protein
MTASAPHQVQTADSSNISMISHDARTDELRVQFKGGGRYAYEGVPRSVYVEFLSADSRGAFFAERIRGAFKHKKL